MAVSRLRQDKIHTLGSGIDDTLTPSDHDANAVDLEDTINHMASQLADILGETNWYDAPDISIADIDAKTFLDEKLANSERWNVTDVTVPNGQNYKILSVAGNEISNTINKATVGTTKGWITALHTGTFGTHALDEVAGLTNTDPQNLVAVIDASTGDPITDSNEKKIWALLQHESGATDGTAFTDVTPQRAQISFVVTNATNDDLVACTIADIEDKVINLGFVYRNDLDSWVAQDFLRRSAHVDVAVGSETVTLDNAIDNQGSTPVTQSTDILDRIADSSKWAFQDSTGARDILAVLPAAAGDEVEINADTFDVNVGGSGVIDFDQGATIDSGGQSINIGTTAGQIDSTTLKLDATTGVAELEGVGVTLDATTSNLVADGVILDADFTDSSHIDMRASSADDKTLRIEAANDGSGHSILDLSSEDGDLRFQTETETTPLPLDDSTAGAISSLFSTSHASVSAAIAYAGTIGGADLTMSLSVLGSNYAKDVNVPGATFDQTGFTLDMSGDAATMFVFLNGRMLTGASAADVYDVYPGTTPASGDLKFSYQGGVKSGDHVIAIGLKQ